MLKKALSLTNGCVQIFSQGKLEELFALDDSFCDRAAECGVRSFQIMAGVLDQESISFSSELLSYEGPFGVGYAVAAFEVLKPIHDANCTETETECHQRGEDAEAQTKRDLDPYVALAHASIESFVKTNTSLVRPENLSEEMINTKAGVFVSIHEAGEL